MWTPQNARKMSLAKRNHHHSNALRCSRPQESPWISQSENKSLVLAWSILKLLDFISSSLSPPSGFTPPFFKGTSKNGCQDVINTFHILMNVLLGWKETRAAIHGRDAITHWCAAVQSFRDATGLLTPGPCCRAGHKEKLLLRTNHFCSQQDKFWRAWATIENYPDIPEDCPDIPTWNYTNKQTNKV